LPSAATAVHDAWVHATFGVNPADYARGGKTPPAANDGPPGAPGAPAPPPGAPGGPDGGAPRPIALPQVSGDSQEALAASMKALDSIKLADAARGLFSITVNGKEVLITEAQADDLRAKARAAMQRNITHIFNRAEEALDRYKGQKDVDDDFPIVSRVVKAVETVRTWGEFEDPGEKLYEQIDFARKGAAAATALITGGQFEKAGRVFANAEAASYRALGMARAYCDGIQDGGSLSIKILEATRDTAFTVDAALAIVVTGGAATGAVGATTTVFGAEVATVGTANAIAVGAPIIAQVGTVAEKLALGDKIDWGKEALDLGIQLILAKFGGKIGQGIAGNVSKRLAGRLAADGIANLGVSKIVSSLVMQEGSATLQTVAHTLYDKLRGRDITWEQFGEQLEQALTDPQGLATAAVLGAVDAKMSHAPATPPPPPHSGGGGVPPHPGDPHAAPPAPPPAQPHAEKPADHPADTPPSHPAAPKPPPPPQLSPEQMALIAAHMQAQMAAQQHPAPAPHPPSPQPPTNAHPAEPPKVNGGRPSEPHVGAKPPAESTKVVAPHADPHAADAAGYAEALAKGDLTAAAGKLGRLPADSQLKRLADLKPNELAKIHEAAIAEFGPDSPQARMSDPVHRADLEFDPASAADRANERDTALRTEQKAGAKLKRYKPPAAKPGEKALKGDWVDENNKVYDGCSPAHRDNFDRNMAGKKGNFRSSLQKHLDNKNVDFVVVDLTGLELRPDQIAVVEKVILEIAGSDNPRIIRIP
jgi:hypothetical protein